MAPGCRGSPAMPRESYHTAAGAGHGLRSRVVQTASSLSRGTSAVASVAKVTTFCSHRPRLVFALTLAMAELITLGEARDSSRVVVDKEARDASTRAAVAVLTLLFVLCGGGIAWCLYLEMSPEVWKTRIVMYVVVLIAAVIEAGCCLQNIFQLWMLPVLVGLNVWGELDAVMRFPVLHGFDTWFACKHLLLLAAKVGLYIVGISSFADDKVTFFSLLMFNVIGLPLMYVLALPLDEVSPDMQGGARGVVDVDISVRIFRLVTASKERKEAWTHCKSRARYMAAVVAQRSPAAIGGAMCRIDPQLQRMVQKTGRDV